MIPVILETPYGNKDSGIVYQNVEYARLCMRDCLLKGEAPFASHLLYTQPGVLDDNVPSERKHGIEAGFVWRELAKKTVVYIDRGVTTGMRQGIRDARVRGCHIVYRKLVKNELGGHIGVDLGVNDVAGLMVERED